MKQNPTGWFCVATAGPTVDGREIKVEWLIDAAETYNPATYTAMIWPSSIDKHQKWYNLGTIHSVKCESVGGKTKLFARFLPNRWMLSLNRDEQQKLFPSVEIVQNFAGTGKYYLSGIAVTDLPASTGTDKLEFSGAPDVLRYCSGEPLTEITEKESILARLFSRTSKTGAQENDEQGTIKEKKVMNEQQFTQFMSAFTAAVENMGSTVNEIKTFAAKQPAPVVENIENNKSSVEEGKSQGGVTTEQFAALEGKLDQLVQSFTALTGEKTKQPTGEPAQTVPDYLV
ncbi:GPO family capsid scaffolding protein [Escherichia coli]|uniref:GPO family capsid scaffolding protein n=2 Tax=Escherichia coli TaxID=562 RepID=UPI00067DC1E5|nr:GPO family capsid scaffolding protein [Escherichia coli]EFN9924994.1 capsid scaffolding protein [Escherichia coli]EGB1671344.1 hypothetical protein [Escherichia coli]EHM2956316.1 GPO family capsid scaffolding protein [Escherichia coli]EMB3559069.1 GPO family capsid scaffolding protein [Escherichia coli]HCS7293447.1 GPO family capsid scaffolding protein [Escherichia coli]